jgi:hypothetical protein
MTPSSLGPPSPPTQSTRVVRFGVFEVDLQTAELRKQGVRIRLPSQSSRCSKPCSSAAENWSPAKS